MDFLIRFFFCWQKLLRYGFRTFIALLAVFTLLASTGSSNLVTLSAGQAVMENGWMDQWMELARVSFSLSTLVHFKLNQRVMKH